MPARKKPQTHNDLAAIFADADVARQHLEQIRWKGEPYCPHCGNIGAYKLGAKAGSKRPVRPGVWKCSACRKQFTVTVGTVFERSHIPLNQWIHTMYLMCASKKGVSANQVSRMLGVTYKTAWFMCHRIRKAMESGMGGFEPATGMPAKRYDRPEKKLTGTVEADETYVGGWRSADAQRFEADRGEAVDLPDDSSGIRTLTI